MKTHTLESPVECSNPPNVLRDDIDWQIVTAGFERFRNYKGGPSILCAVCTARSGDGRRHYTITDIATRMKIADWLIRQGVHDGADLPDWIMSNRDEWYGPRGRGFAV